MSQISDIKLPNINTSGLSNEKYAKKITNYLMSLEESLRYMFGNIDEDNITEHFVDTVIVKNLLVTNGDNSIIVNPEDGFQMLKGQKKQLSFDINTGKATFGGDIIGALIFSDNYIEGVSGMKIDLTNGTLKTPQASIDEEGAITSTGENRTTKISNGFIETSFIELKEDKKYVQIAPFDIICADTEDTYTSLVDIKGSSISLVKDGATKILMNMAGHIDCTDMTCDKINDGIPITDVNYDDYCAPVNHIQSSATVDLLINGDYTAYFLNGKLAATPSYCHANFQPLSASDFRLKKNITSLDNLPDEIYFNLKPYMFEFKTDSYGKGINIGLLAQEVEKQFSDNQLNPYDYHLIELRDVRKWTDEGMYVSDGKVHTVNYEQLITWGIDIDQKQQKVLDKNLDDISKMILRITQIEDVLIKNKIA